MAQTHSVQTPSEHARAGAPPPTQQSEPLAAAPPGMGRGSPQSLAQVKQSSLKPQVPSPHTSGQTPQSLAQHHSAHPRRRPHRHRLG